MTGIKSRIFPSVLTVTSSLATGYVHRCVFLFSFSLHFHLLCFLFIINFLQDSSWLLDMFGEPGGSVGSGGGLPTRVLGRVLGSWGSAIIYVLSPRLCGQQQQQSGSNCIELCLDTTVRKKKKESPTEGVGSAVGEDELCVCAGCDSVFPPAAPLGPGRVFLWLVLNTESIPFPCKDDFSSKFCVCTAAKMLP